MAAKVVTFGQLCKFVRVKCRYPNSAFHSQSTVLLLKVKSNKDLLG